MCDIDYADGPSHYWGIRRKAREPHHCNECGRKIGKGEQYSLGKSVNEDGWQQNRICAHCSVAVQWLMSECRGYVFRGVLDDLTEHLSEPIASVSLAKLVVGMTRDWRSFRGTGLLPIPKLPRVSMRNNHV